VSVQDRLRRQWKSAARSDSVGPGNVTILDNVPAPTSPIVWQKGAQSPVDAGLRTHLGLVEERGQAVPLTNVTVATLSSSAIGVFVNSGDYVAGCLSDSVRQRPTSGPIERT
jgi:hypothetical protein